MGEEKFWCSYSGEVTWVDVTTLECILRRPVLYTANGTYAEVVAYLEGYLAGAGYYHIDNWEYGFRNQPFNRDADEIAQLIKWMARCLDTFPFKVFSELRTKFDSDEEALEELRRLLQEFCADSKEKL